MSESRDKFLTEKMGACWHGLLPNNWMSKLPLGGRLPPDVNTSHYRCSRCGEYTDKSPIEVNPNFSDWPGLGILWNWAKEQEWIDRFYIRLWKIHIRGLPSEFIDPYTFATELAKFLGWEGEK
jgi:hypothetical protein